MHHCMQQQLLLLCCLSACFITLQVGVEVPKKMHMVQHGVICVGAYVALWICRVSCSEAAGRVSAELLCPYPPGVPAAIPGELLQHSTIQHLLEVLKTGGTVTGLTDPTLATCLVIAK